MSPVQALSLKQLNLKFCMLISLLAVPRSQTLKALTLANMSISASDITFKITTLLKINKQGKKAGQYFHLSEYPPDGRLCVLRFLKCYLMKTRSFWGDETQLFISYRKPHKMVSTHTLARWVQEVMALAGVDTIIFKTHAARAESVSAARAGLVPIAEVIDRAKWVNEHTF